MSNKQQIKDIEETAAIVGVNLSCQPAPCLLVIPRVRQGLKPLSHRRQSVETDWRFA